MYHLRYLEYLIVFFACSLPANCLGYNKAKSLSNPYKICLP